MKEYKYNELFEKWAAYNSDSGIYRDRGLVNRNAIEEKVTNEMIEGIEIPCSVNLYSDEKFKYISSKEWHEKMDIESIKYKLDVLDKIKDDFTRYLTENKMYIFINNLREEREETLQKISEAYNAINREELDFSNALPVFLQSSYSNLEQYRTMKFMYGI